MVYASGDLVECFPECREGPNGDRVVHRPMRMLAGIWHTVQGALALLASRVPALARRPGPIRQVVAFVTLAAGIPGVVVVLWPALVGIPT